MSKCARCSTDKSESNSQWQHGDPRALQPGGGLVSRGGGASPITQVMSYQLYKNTPIENYQNNISLRSHIRLS